MGVAVAVGSEVTDAVAVRVDVACRVGVAVLASVGSTVGLAVSASVGSTVALAVDVDVASVVDVAVAVGVVSGASVAPDPRRVVSVVAVALVVEETGEGMLEATVAAVGMIADRRRLQPTRHGRAAYQGGQALAEVDAALPHALPH